MNIYELLDSYQTTPFQEIKKINTILARKVTITFSGTKSLKDLLGETYKVTYFGSFEPNIDDFVNNIVMKGFNVTDVLSAINNYRMYCELLLVLLDGTKDSNFAVAFSSDMKQLKKMIESGLDKSGYKIIQKDGHKVTIKKDEEAEMIAATNKEYNKNILDYLLAKSVDQKEKVLTSLAIQLEAAQPKDDYSKKNREFVQLLRHKDENIDNPKYSWFFEANTYENNLDKLFRVFLSIISHDNAHEYIKEFSANKANSSQNP